MIDEKDSKKPAAKPDPEDVDSGFDEEEENIRLGLQRLMNVQESNQGASDSGRTITSGLLGRSQGRQDTSVNRRSGTVHTINGSFNLNDDPNQLRATSAENVPSQPEPQGIANVESVSGRRSESSSEPEDNVEDGAYIREKVIGRMERMSKRYNTHGYLKIGDDQQQYDPRAQHEEAYENFLVDRTVGGAEGDDRMFRYMRDAISGSAMTMSFGVLTGNVFQDLNNIGLSDGSIGLLSLGLAYSSSFMSTDGLTRIPAFLSWDDIRVTYKMRNGEEIDGSQRVGDEEYIEGRGDRGDYRLLTVRDFGSCSNEDVTRVMSFFKGKEPIIKRDLFNIAGAHQVKRLNPDNLKAYYASKSVYIEGGDFGKMCSCLDSIINGLPKIVGNPLLMQLLDMESDWVIYHTYYSQVAIDVVKALKAVPKNIRSKMFKQSTINIILESAASPWDVGLAQRIPTEVKAFLYAYLKLSDELPESEYYGPKRHYENMTVRNKKKLEMFAGIVKHHNENMGDFAKVNNILFKDPLEEDDKL